MEERKEHHMIPIWLFIGSLLVVYGVLIIASGIYYWSNSLSNLPMSDKHADVWWGAVILAIGIIYVVRFRPGRVAAMKEQEQEAHTRFD